MRQRRRFILTFTCLGALALASRAFGGDPLPDLVPEIFDFSDVVDDVDAGDVAEGCAGGPNDRRLLRFSLRTYNQGTADLVLGDPGCPDCTANPGAMCANPLFECSTAHGHVHFDSFAHSDLLDANQVVIAHGHKHGFCILDSECHEFTYTCNFQGLTAGCSDVYSGSLPCQYIDLTDADVPAGTYTLRVTSDPDDLIDEADEGNNVVSAQIVLGGPPATPTPMATPFPLCQPSPRTNCQQSPRSSVTMRNSPDHRKDRLVWQWVKGASSKALFGNPLAVTRYELCLYDETGSEPALLTRAVVPNAGTCGRRPCWRRAGTQGYRYGDNKAAADGITTILLKKGLPGKAKVTVRGKGVHLPLPTLPLQPYGQLRVQLVNSDNECWESVYSTPADVNVGERFKDTAP
jgi:hypothetical protein